MHIDAEPSYLVTSMQIKATDQRVIPDDVLDLVDVGINRLCQKLRPEAKTSEEPLERIWLAKRCLIVSTVLSDTYRIALAMLMSRDDDAFYVCRKKIFPAIAADIFKMQCRPKDDFLICAKRELVEEIVGENAKRYL